MVYWNVMYSELFPFLTAYRIWKKKPDDIDYPYTMWQQGNTPISSLKLTKNDFAKYLILYKNCSCFD